MYQYKFPEECEELSKAKDIMHFEEISMVDGNNRKQSRILIITSWEFFFFKSRFFSCGTTPLDLLTKFRWIDITKLSSTKLTKIFISFKKDNNRFESSLSKINKKNIAEGDTDDGNPTVGIISKNPDRLLLKIFSYIISYSLETEYPKFFMDQDVYNFLLEKSYRDVLNHVSIRMKGEDKIVPYSVVNKIQSFVTKQDPVLKLSKFKSFGPCLQYFLECIHWFPFVKKIVINFNAFRQYMRENQKKNSANSKNLDIIQTLVTQMQIQNEIVEIEFRDRVPMNFQLLLNFFVKSKKQFHTAIFVNCDLNTSQLAALDKWIDTGTIEYLYLISTISPINGPTFISSLEHNDGAQMLRKINISRLSRLEISSLISYLPRIRYLSLQYCDFEINEFFYLINNTPTPCQIETVILSGNRNTRRIQPKLQFPPYLREINVSNIFWESESFKNFFQSVLLHQPIQNPKDFDDYEIVRNSPKLRKKSTRSQIKSEDDENEDQEEKEDNENQEEKEENENQEEKEDNENQEEKEENENQEEKEENENQEEKEDNNEINENEEKDAGNIENEGDIQNQDGNETTHKKKKKVVKKKAKKSEAEDHETTDIQETPETQETPEAQDATASTTPRKKKVVKKKRAATTDDDGQEGTPASTTRKRVKKVKRKTTTDDDINNNNPGTPATEGDEPQSPRSGRKRVKKKLKSDESTPRKTKEKRKPIERIPNEFDKDDFSDNDNMATTKGNDQITLRLDVSGAILSEADWKDFFKYVQVMKYKTTLGTLRWNTNKLHKAFFLFLNRCEDLRNLSLDGCFSNDDDILPFLVAYLSSTQQRIHYFSCAGTSSRWLGKDGSKMLIQFLASNRSVQSLNISNNHSGVEMFLELPAILNRNMAIQSIQIDGNDIASVSAYRRFFTALTNRGKPLFITWPEQEVKDMLQYGTARHDDIQELIELYQLVLNGDSKKSHHDSPKKKKIKRKRTETDAADTDNEVVLPNAADVF